MPGPAPAASAHRRTGRRPGRRGRRRLRLSTGSRPSGKRGGRASRRRPLRRAAAFAARGRGTCCSNASGGRAPRSTGADARAGSWAWLARRTRRVREVAKRASGEAAVGRKAGAGRGVLRTTTARVGEQASKGNRGRRRAAAGGRRASSVRGKASEGRAEQRRRATC